MSWPARSLDASGFPGRLESSGYTAAVMQIVNREEVTMNGMIGAFAGLIEKVADPDGVVRGETDSLHLGMLKDYRRLPRGGGSDVHV